MAIKCLFHKETEIYPLMIQCGESPLGNRQYVCARCARIREFGNGEIVSIKNNTGFINNGKRNIRFNFRGFKNKIRPETGMNVRFEIAFYENGFEAIDIENCGPMPSGKKNQKIKQVQTIF